MSGASEALAEMSEKLTEETDLHPDGADLVVTKGPAVEGNEVTVVLTDEDTDEKVILGFDGEAFDEIVGRLVSGSDRSYVDPSDREVLALHRLIDTGAWELDVDQREAVERLQGRLPRRDEVAQKEELSADE